MLWFTFSQNKIIGATRNEQLNFFIDCMDPQPAAPTNPVVDDDNNAFAWTNTPGFDSLDDYEYSLDSGSSWLNCTGNPQDIKNVDLAAGAVQVRVKEVIKESNGNYVRPAGAALLSDQAYTIPGHSAGNMNGAGVTIIIHGWQPVSGEPSWTGAMQEAIIEKALGNEGAAGKITVTGSKGNLSVSCNSGILTWPMLPTEKSSSGWIGRR